MSDWKGEESSLLARLDAAGFAIHAKNGTRPGGPYLAGKDTEEAELRAYIGKDGIRIKRASGDAWCLTKWFVELTDIWTAQWPLP